MVIVTVPQDVYLADRRMRLGCQGRNAVLAICSCILALYVTLGCACGQVGQKIEIDPIVGHSDVITSVAFSPDGKLILSGSVDNSLKLWDAGSGALLRTFIGHGDTVTSGIFSKDGRYVLSGGADRNVKLWDAVTGTALRNFDGSTDTIFTVALSPDGSRVLAGGLDGTLRLWDLESGKLLQTIQAHANSVFSAAFTSDGARIVSGGRDNLIKLWNGLTGSLLRTFKGHSGEVTSLALSADGTRLLSGSLDKTLKLWETNTGDLLQTFTGHGGPVLAAALSPSGKTALSGSGDRTAKLWDIASGKLLVTIQGHGDSVDSAAYSPDGTRLITGSYDRTLRSWDGATGASLKVFGAWSDTTRSVALSGDGRLAISGGDDDTLKLWDLEKGRLLRVLDGHSGTVFAVAFSPDGQAVLSGSKDGTLKLWDHGTGAILRNLRGHTGPVYGAAFSPDGKYIASGSRDNTIKLWDGATGAPIHTLAGHSGWVYSVAFSPNGRHLLSASTDSLLKLWDVETGTLLLTFKGHAGFVAAAIFSPDGRYILSGGEDKTIKLWDAETGALLRTFGEQPGWISSLAFSPDSKVAVSVSAPSMLSYWDVRTGQNLEALTSFTGVDRSVAFSRDGYRVLTGGDSAMTLWSRGKKKPLVTFFANKGGRSLAITSEGFFAGSEEATGMINVVRGFESFSIMQFYDHLYRPDLIEELLKGDLEGKYKNASNLLNLESILGSGAPPKFERLQNREITDGNKVRLAVRLIDRGGGIGEKVVWRVNGVVQGATSVPGLAGPVSPGRYVVMDQTFTFDPKVKNEVSVVAYNRRGLLATTPFKLTVDPFFGPIVDEPPKLFVLAVGVNEYVEPTWHLRFAATDAKSVAKALQEVGSGIFGTNVKINIVTDQEATEQGIGAVFAQLAEEVKPRDVFILYLSGHGRAIAGSGWFFLPANLKLGPQSTIENKAIGQDKLQNWLGQIQALKSVIILDACEAGAAETLKSVDSERDTVIDQLQHATGRNTIAAAEPGQAAYEGYRDHGVLTYAFLEALNKDEGLPDDFVDLLTVAAHLSRRVPEISAATFGVRQRPKTDLKDNFPLGVRKPVLRTAALFCQSPQPGQEASYFAAFDLKMLQGPSETAPVIMELKRNWRVTLKACEGAWALIERGGKNGYVAYSALESLK